MKVKRTIIAVIILISLLQFFEKDILGFEISSPIKIKFSKQTAPPQQPWSICIDEHGLFILPDAKSSSVRIYERHGSTLTLLTNFGIRGYEPFEFIKPTYSYYDMDSHKLCILDNHRRKVIVYVKDYDKFTEYTEIPCLRLGYDLFLKKDILYISGIAKNPVENGKSYAFYSVDLLSNKRKYLLPAYKKFGHKNDEEYNQKKNDPNFQKKTKFKMKGFIDYYGEKFFFTGAAHNTVHYIEQGNVKQFCKIDKEKSATITNIFVKYKENSNETTKMTANYSIPEAIMVSLKIEDKTLNHEEHRIQFFSLQGKFIEEIVIPNYYSKEDPFTNHSIKPDHKMWWDKKENVLYMLCNIKNPDKDDYDFFILQYLISSK